MIGETIQSVQYDTNRQLNVGQYLQASTNVSNRPRALLYLFSPTEVVHEARRPHVYQFGPEFLEDLHTSLTDQLHMPTDSHSSAFMLDKVQAHMAIVPSYAPQRVNTTPFGSMWKFILMVDNEPVGTSAGRRTPLIRSNRVLYRGVCLDEPCNPVTVNGHTSININAALQILHHTYMDISKSIHGNGPIMNARVTHDRHIIQPNFIQGTDGSANGEIQARLDPGAIGGAYIPTFQNSFQYTPVDAHIRPNEYGIPLETDISSPRKHLQVLMQPVFNTIKQMSEDTLISPHISAQAFSSSIPDEMTIKENLDSSVKNAYRLHTPNLMTSVLDTTRPRTISELLGLFPEMTIQPLEIPLELPVDVRDPFSINPTNVLTSIISSSAPSYLTMCGLSHASFTYTSYMPGAFVKDDQQYNVKVHDIGSIIPEAPTATRGRWGSFLRHMRDQVFSTIQHIGGAFEVNVSVQSAGACYVQLFLLEQTNQFEKSFTTTNSYFSGINTPLIGPEAVLEANVNQVAELLPNVARLVSCV